MNVPKLRFKGLQGQWRHKKISEILQKVSRQVDVDLKRMYQQIGIRSHGKGLFHKEPVSGASLGNKRIFWLDENLFVLNIVFAWEQAVAKTTFFEIGLVASHRFPMFKPKEGLSVTDYILHFFLTNKGKHYLGLASPGGAGRNKTLGQKNFEELVVILPDVEEQTKIANFLTAVDEKITQLTQKYDLLKQYKKGVMQQIFSQKLRFKDDDGREFPEWEEVKFSNLDIYISDGNYGEQYPKSDELKLVGVPFIRANNISGLGLTWTDMKFIDNSLHQALTSGHLEEDDILITTRGDIGMVALVSNEFHGANINAQICLLRIINKSKLNNRYLLQLLSSDYCQKQFTELQTGSALKQLPKRNLLQMGILYPVIKEQTKIANFLTAIDDKIAQAQTQLDAVKQYKKGLLQQLFV